MIGIAILLAGAAVAHGIARWFDIPATPVLILAGVLLAQLGLLPAEMLQESLVLGLTFLLFAAGIELSPGRVRAQRGAALRVGILQFITLGALGTMAAMALGHELLTSMYFGLALTASSTLIVVRLLQKRKQIFEPAGRLVVGVLLLQDLFVILLIPLLVRAPEGARAIVTALLPTLALLALCFVTLRWITPRLARLHREEEVLLLAALTVLFSFVGLAGLLEVPVAAGAFLAGVALSSFPMSGVTRGQLGSVGDFFTAIFFLALGGLLGPPAPRVLFDAAVLALVVVLVTPVLVALVAERAGFAARPAIESGLLLSQTSELSLVVGLQGLLVQHITQSTFTTLALVTVGTMVLTPFLATEAVVRRLLRFHPLRPDPPGRSPSDHVLLLGCGAGGMPLLDALIDDGDEVFVIDDDPHVISTLRARGVDCYRGDASDPQALEAGGAARARLVSSTVRRPRDNEALLKLAADRTVLVRVFDDEDADWVAERGGTPILYSDAAAEEFVEWYDSHCRKPESGEKEE